jgi:ankyrin repeat protein
MSARHLPVRPDLQQLKHQAKDLLRAIRRAEPEALADLQTFHPRPPAPEHAKLADAQLVLARSYQAPSWARLVVACNLIDAIWEDDADAVRELITKHPHLVHEQARVHDSNWGPPLSYAANLGRDRIIGILREAGATDLMHAIGRAALQGRIDTARLLHRMAGEPPAPPEALSWCAYTLSVSGTEFLFEIGARVRDEGGKQIAPVGVVLCTDSRRPDAKHRILELYVAHGAELPDTAPMAVHRGRVDLLAAHLRRDPALLRRTFSYAELFPPELGCEQPDPVTGYEGLPRTPLAGATLLHLCVEFDELDIARWLLDRGMDANAPAAVDALGFGGHTALFGSVVSYANFWMNYGGGWSHNRKPQDAAFARLLLDHGAHPNARATFREVLASSDQRTTRDHREITPIAWGDVYHDKLVVSVPAMREIAARGGLS